MVGGRRAGNGGRGGRRSGGSGHALAPVTDADPETTTVDGLARRNVNEGYAALRAGAGNGHNDDSTIFQVTLSSNDDGTWAGITRAFMLFDLSNILAGNRTVLSATLSYVVHLHTDNHDPQFVALVPATPASDIDLVNADYAVGNFRMDELLAPVVALNDMVTGTRQEYVFNAVGVAYLQEVIDGDQIARIGAVLESDRTGVEPTHPGAPSIATTHSIRSAEYSATVEAGNTPTLTVHYR